MEPQSESRHLRSRERIDYSVHSSSEDESESESAPDASKKTAENQDQRKSANNGPPVAPQASALSVPEPLFSIPDEIQVKVPHMWHLNTALQGFYKGKPFPPHIDVAQLIKSFFRSNIFTEGVCEHRAMTKATAAMEEIYNNYFLGVPWYQWWLPDPAGPVKDDEVNMVVERGPPPYLSPATLLAAVCVHNGDKLPPDEWDHFWHLFAWMLQDPATWPETMPPFWKGSRFDDPAWIKANFQPDPVTSNTVPPEIGTQDVNAWLHGPGVIETVWKVGIRAPKFPTDWDSYLNSKWQQIHPAPEWILDALELAQGQCDSASESESQRQGDKEDMLSEPPDNAVPPNPDPSTSNQPSDPAKGPPVAFFHGPARRIPESAQNPPDAAPGAGSNSRRTHHSEVGPTPDSLQDMYDCNVLALAEIQCGLADICNGSLEDIREAVDGVREISANIKTGRDRIIQKLLDKEEAYHKLIKELLDHQAVIRKSIAYSELHVQDSEILLQRLEAELIKRDAEDHRARKRRKTQQLPQPGQSISSTPQVLGDNDLVHAAVASAATAEDINILRVTYTKHYQTPEYAQHWPSYKRAISKFMPILNRFAKQDWERGFGVFKAKLESLAVGMTLPKDDALKKMYRVEMTARMEMECWSPIYGREMPTFVFGEVFGEE